MSATFHRLIAADALEDRTLLPFVVNGWSIFVCRDEGGIHVLLNRCSHAAAPLAPAGRVRRGIVMCPLHGARFRLDNGICASGADHKPLKIFPWRETAEGWIEVAVPDEAPGAEHMPITPLS
jgi:nitrite reductase/ring-hydroxylating ferredoxin subunit